jgi:hypothetical protein
MPRSWSPMLERYVTALQVEDAGLEEPAETRDRLRDAFPRGATRRMTQLGLIVGRCLLDLNPGETDALIYLSGYAETRALEGYLESFPAASPTLFQTSIHPSAVEQALIGRQQAVRQFLPLTGEAHLVAQGLTAAMLAAESRVLVCGGEERGTWLLKLAAASDRTFAFAFALSTEPAGALARVRLDPVAATSPAEACPLPHFFDLLAARESFAFTTPGACRLEWTWL